MPSLREEYEDVMSRLTHQGQRERSEKVYGDLARELDALDYKLEHASLPPDERVELAKLSAQTRGGLDRRLHDLRHPTILSPQPARRPERGWGFEGFDRSR